MKDGSYLEAGKGSKFPQSFLKTSEWVCGGKKDSKK